MRGYDDEQPQKGFNRSMSSDSWRDDFESMKSEEGGDDWRRNNGAGHQPTRWSK